MNKCNHSSTLLGLFLLMILSVCTGSATPVRERELQTKREHESTEKMEKHVQMPGHRQNSETQNDLILDLSAMTRGRVQPSALRAAMKNKFSLSEGNSLIEVDLAKTGQTLKEAKVRSGSLNRNELNAEALRLLQEKMRALEVIPRFMALASITSKPLLPQQKKNLNVFIKELSLIESMLLKMDASELKSHLEVMELAIENKSRNSELEGDQAYAQALKEKFGERVEEKMDAILGCIR